MFYCPVLHDIYQNMAYMIYRSELYSRHNEMYREKYSLYIVQWRNTIVLSVKKQALIS